MLRVLARENRRLEYRAIGPQTGRNSCHLGGFRSSMYTVHYEIETPASTCQPSTREVKGD